MSVLRLLKRATETALKLPLAATWDVLTLGNFGEATSTGKVIREHERQKRRDEAADLLDEMRGTR